MTGTKIPFNTREIEVAKRMEQEGSVTGEAAAFKVCWLTHHRHPHNSHPYKAQLRLPRLAERGPRRAAGLGPLLLTLLRALTRFFLAARGIHAPRWVP